MKRRDLLRAASAAAGALAVSPLLARADRVSAEIPEAVDVLVVGGGTAGTIAALQAALAGAKTALVEVGSQLGGTTTTGGVNYPGLFHAWGRQVIAGLGWQLVEKTVELDGGTMPDFSRFDLPHSALQVRINGQLYAALAEEACLKAGASLAYYQFPLSIEATPRGWTVDVVGSGVRHPLACKQLIDCTGGADVVGMLGLARLREDTTQPGTLAFRFGGYDAAKLDREQIQRRYRQALEDGTLEHGDYSHAGGSFVGFLAGGGKNAQHVFGADSSTALARTRSNIAGRQSVLRLLRFIRSLPGCEQARLLEMMQETAVRETYRIQGETLITCDDYTSGRRYDDAVAYAIYPVDLHDKEGVRPQPLAEGTVPTIPFGALIPKGSCNLLVAGRSVSSDRLANSALRVQAPCMAMGQAAGAAAALASATGITPGVVPIDRLRSLLGEHGAIVP
ncbi:MAG: FAD-dependent oxidoreductase [Thermoguttaceae bacterium]